MTKKSEKTVAGQFAEKPTCGQSSRGMVNSQTSHLADRDFKKITDRLHCIFYTEPKPGSSIV